MRIVTAVLGGLFTLAGVIALTASLFMSSTTAGNTDGDVGGWRCQVSVGTEDCRYTGNSPASAVASADNDLAVGLFGLGLTLGGCVLLAAATVADARPSRNPNPGPVPPPGGPGYPTGRPYPSG